MSDSDDQSEPGRAYRAREFLSGSATEEELDAATLAELAAWFGAPPPPPEESEAEQRERLRRGNQARIAEAVDARLVERLEAHVHAAESMLRLPSAPRLAVLRQLGRFDARAWRLDIMEFTGEPRDRPVPEDLAGTMEERTPQSMLRDLYRPELYFWSHQRTLTNVGPDPEDQAALQRVRESVSQRVSVALAAPGTARQAMADMTEMRAQLAEPWAPVATGAGVAP